MTSCGLQTPLQCGSRERGIGEGCVSALCHLLVSDDKVWAVWGDLEMPYDLQIGLRSLQIRAVQEVNIPVEMEIIVCSLL